MQSPPLIFEVSREINSPSRPARPPLYNPQKIAMQITSRRKKIAFFLILGICLVAAAVALTVSWIILNWREGVLLFFGVIFFVAIILD